MCADYTRSEIQVYNSTFFNNAAEEGGVFCTRDWSLMACHECIIYENFAMKAGIIIAETNGYFNITGSQIYNNHALDVVVADLTDVTLAGEFASTHIHDNVVMLEDEFFSEAAECTKLCFIEPSYLDYYRDDHSSVIILPPSLTIIKVTKAKVVV